MCMYTCGKRGPGKKDPDWRTQAMMGVFLDVPPFIPDSGRKCRHAFYVCIMAGGAGGRARAVRCFVTPGGKYGTQKCSAQHGLYK